MERVSKDACRTAETEGAAFREAAFPLKAEAHDDAAAAPRHDLEQTSWVNLATFFRWGSAPAFSSSSSMPL